nr:hypothetical protein [Tanacetum cinerariifolium]
MFPVMCLEHPLSMTPLSFKAYCGLPSQSEDEVEEEDEKAMSAKLVGSSSA